MFVPIIVSQEALVEESPGAATDSNVASVNMLFERHFRPHEIHPDALDSYYADFFIAQLDNGGFLQFVYNSKWNASIGHVTSGLRKIGATEHLELFDQTASAMAQHVGEDDLPTLTADCDWVDDHICEFLATQTEAFYKLREVEEPTSLNTAFLREHADLHALPRDAVPAAMDRLAASLPDFEDRKAAALAAEPRYFKLVRALCVESGHEFQRITAGDYSATFQDKPVMMAWHFLTEQGHYRMVDVNNVAWMLEGTGDGVICRIEAGPSFD